jgi:hypothetical protein
MLGHMVVWVGVDVGGRRKGFDAVRGYSLSCRLAAYLHGRLQVYLAQSTVHHHIEPLPCALHRTRLLGVGSGPGWGRVEFGHKTTPAIASPAG